MVRLLFGYELGLIFKEKVGAMANRGSRVSVEGLEEMFPSNSRDLVQGRRQLPARSLSRNRSGGWVERSSAEVKFFACWLRS